MSYFDWPSSLSDSRGKNLQRKKLIYFMVKLENYKNLFYQAMRIRLVEEKIIELYPSDLIQSPVHLSIGQEAVAVGVCQI
jgi:TPP-dependent pyruvate/acetoin dehydrogenase alpha subunit